LIPNIEAVWVALVSISLEPPPKKGGTAVGELLIKLQIDGGDFEQNNEDGLLGMTVGAVGEAIVGLNNSSSPAGAHSQYRKQAE
jgi:hypothetical protein